MINFDDYTNENIIEHNLNIEHNQPDIDKIYLYAKDPYEKKISIFN